MHRSGDSGVQATAGQRMQLMTNPDLTVARLAVLPLALLEWLVIWLNRYIPVPIRNAPIRVLVQAVAGILVVTPWFFQTSIYRSISGVRVLGKDHFFMALTVTEHAVALGIMYRIAFERRKREQRDRKYNDSDSSASN